MEALLDRVKSLFIKTAHCEAPVPPPPGKAAEENKVEEEPIVFDELENPALVELQKKFPKRPPAFEALLAPLRMASMIEPLEGAKLEVGFGLSQRMQLTNTWLLPHAAPGNYEVTFVFVGGKMTSPYDMLTPNPLMMARYSPSTGRQDIKLICRPHNDLEVKLSANYMSADPRESQVTAEAEYLGADYVAGLKSSIALDFFSYHYSQTVTDRLVLGFELMNMTKPRTICSLSYGGKYTTGINSYFAQYLAFQDSLTVGATMKANPNIQFGTQLDFNFTTGDNELTTSMVVRFTKAKFTGALTGSGKLSAHLQHALNPFAKFSLNAEADLVKQDQKFGISLNIGGH
mmetsp:Transcript_11978/g.22917  ORF Transcript_11978/g.22917 Transcript_11978/m.22917 type:complete len:345 (+) Transcript_11978:248-1282(+)|eukprot:CAMPEP_0204898924 /NCGR_PEP_ID=MMETSP1397-20131031/1556_1 /ASSEMBLY_ACC=CAM_ASM_000891 /TAXON_ID=49980 /ORGANISM="Climacostomum Climacostomum virens, Strain Stock W-24" /LENGTH=344 /DNA_ID=CAMNT_0052066815 /DNA_START=210 /DNA_END=1244 /DNA_ORIENTATION=+